MCGIGGILTKGSEIIASSEVARMADVMLHRGPDDQGFLRWGGDSSHAFQCHRKAQALTSGRLWLMHRRLSIIDAGDGGWQPMASADGRFAIVFNGEIYNYRELRRELGDQGYVFKTNSDTEVLLAALVMWGTKAIRRFAGMFAFAFLDIENKRLLLARDPFGMKPLYYMQTPNNFTFSSEIKALLSLPMVSRRADSQQAYDYLRYGYSDMGRSTFFNEIKQLPSAHWMELDIEDPTQIIFERYWTPGLEPKTEQTFENAAERLRALFLESVRLHLRSDVPVGATLSGGIDSASTVSAIRHLAGDKHSLHTFSYIADDPYLNEEKWIDHMGTIAGSHVHKVHPTPRELADDLDTLIMVQDEPFASTSVYAQYRVFQLAKQRGIKVTLDGQGADEYLAGYPVFTAARAASMLSAGRMLPALGTVVCTSRDNGVGLINTTMRMMQHALPVGLRPMARRLIGERAYPRWINKDYFQETNTETDRLETRGGNTEIMRNLLIETLTRTSLPALLRYADRNAMAASVESRMPFLSVALVDFVLALPESYVVDRACTTKAVFRSAMRGLVPDVILDRRDKIGFETPQDSWLSTLEPWVAQRLDSVSEILPINAKGLRDEWWIAKRLKTPLPGHLWRALNLTRWAECYGVKFE